jgi:hypothetical protein
LFEESATYTLPKLELETPKGIWNSPAPEPRVPNWPLYIQAPEAVPVTTNDTIINKIAKRIIGLSPC